MSTHHQLTLKQRFTTNSPILQPILYHLPLTSTQAHASTLVDSHARDCFPNTHKQVNKHRMWDHTRTPTSILTMTRQHTPHNRRRGTQYFWRLSRQSQGLAEGLLRSLLMAPGTETLLSALLDVLSPGLAYLLSVVWSNALSKIINHGCDSPSQ